MLHLPAFSSEAPHAKQQKQACGPYVLPSCFWQPRASVRASGHMSGETLEFVVPAKILAPLGPQFCLTHAHRQTIPLCTNAFQFHQHPHAGRHTNISSTHKHTQTFKTHIHSQSCIHLFVYTLAHTPPLITLKCRHTCAATHRHNRHDRQ